MNKCEDCANFEEGAGNEKAQDYCWAKDHAIDGQDDACDLFRQAGPGAVRPVGDDDPFGGHVRIRYEDEPNGEDD